MDISQTLTSVTIQKISRMSSHPVWAIDTDQGICVLKMEISFGSVMRPRMGEFPAEIMSIIDPAARNRALNKAEMFKLRDVANAKGVENEPRPGKVPVTLQAGILEATGAPLTLAPGQPHMPLKGFYLMALLEGVDDLAMAAEKALGGDRSKVKRIAAVLNAPGGLEKLGEILAIDAFNGYRDRVNFPGANEGGADWNGGTLRIIQNVGNFFIADSMGRTTIVGLDTYDPANVLKDPESFGTFKQKDIEEYGYPGGRLLSANAGAVRHKVAEDVAADLATLLGPRNRKIPFANKKRLPDDAAQRIERGIVQGAEKILAHLKIKYANGGLGVPLQRRIQQMGWLTRANFPRL